MTKKCGEKNASARRTLSLYLDLLRARFSADLQLLLGVDLLEDFGVQMIKP